MDQIAPGAAGITLAPFGNRIDGGLWELDGTLWDLDGTRQQLDITEVPRNNAIHGLLRNTGYNGLESSRTHVLLEAVIHPQHGYPFLARHQVRYELLASGDLRVAQTLINDSARPAPFVLGAHPNFTLGTTAAEVSGEFDLRAGKPVPESLMDHAFTFLMTEDGVAWHTLSAQDGRSVSLWHDGSVRYVHVYITAEFPGRSLAVRWPPPWNQ